MKSMNISLKMPQDDYCEFCSELDLKLENFSLDQDSIEAEKVKIEKQNHLQSAAQARQKYRDCAKEPERDDKRIFSVDLQKVIYLPIMPKSKTTFFTSRLSVFNETFATIKPKSKYNSYAVAWHEAIGGRKGSNICETASIIINQLRDVKYFHFFADNCSAQIKNWIFFTMCVVLVNKTSGPNEITVTFLVKGHTHMSADSVHGHIEKAIKRKGNVEDFQDLINLIENASKKIKVVIPENFHNWPNKKKNPTKKDNELKNFNISKVSEVKFVKGKRICFYKTDLSIEEYNEIDFLPKNFKEKCFEPNLEEHTGISFSKKQEIVEKLVPLMQQNRRIFWENILNH